MTTEPISEQQFPRVLNDPRDSLHATSANSVKFSCNFRCLGSKSHVEKQVNLRLPCPECRNTFSTKNTLKVHRLNKHHKVNNSSVWKECNMDLSGSTGSSHQKSNKQRPLANNWLVAAESSSPYSAPSFSTNNRDFANFVSDGAKPHLRSRPAVTSASSKQSLYCSECRAWLSTKFTLKMHLLRVHHTKCNTGERPKFSRNVLEYASVSPKYIPAVEAPPEGASTSVLQSGLPRDATTGAHRELDGGDLEVKLEKMDYKPDVEAGVVLLLPAQPLADGSVKVEKETSVEFSASLSAYPVATSSSGQELAFKPKPDTIVQSNTRIEYIHAMDPNSVSKHQVPTALNAPTTNTGMIMGGEWVCDFVVKFNEASADSLDVPRVLSCTGRINNWSITCCPLCSDPKYPGFRFRRARFATSSEFISHCEVEHGNYPNPFPCARCRSTFTTAAELTEHAYRLPKSGFLCQLCRFVTMDRGNARKHAWLYHADALTKHDDDHKLLNRSSTVRSLSEASATLDKFSSGFHFSSSKPNVKEVNQRHSCPECGNSFSTKHSLKVHRLNIHYKVNKKNLTLRSECKIDLSKSHEPGRHKCDKQRPLMKVPEGAVASTGSKQRLCCPECNSWLASKYGLKRHRLVMHYAKSNRTDAPKLPGTIAEHDASVKSQCSSTVAPVATPISVLQTGFAGPAAIGALSRLEVKLDPEVKLEEMDKNNDMDASVVLSLQPQLSLADCSLCFLNMGGTMGP